MFRYAGRNRAGIFFFLNKKNVMCFSTKKRQNIFFLIEGAKKKHEKRLRAFSMDNTSRLFSKFYGILRNVFIIQLF